MVGETAWDDARRGLAIELSPNCSLTPKQAVGFFASLCVASFAVAGFFALQGLWPVLPFAGLEMAVLGCALAASLRRRHYRQTITLTEAEVEVTTRDSRGARRAVFPRHWARVRLMESGGWQPNRLLIESHGRSCEIGALLTDDERRRLHARLKGFVGCVAESPGLAPA